MPRVEVTVSEPEWLSLDAVILAAREARKRGVSDVATSPGGFVEAFQMAGGDLEDLETRRHRKTGQDWRTRRNNFVARHMAQVRHRNEPLWTEQGEPTRRHLALAVWAFSPTPEHLKKWLVSQR